MREFWLISETLVPTCCFPRSFHVIAPSHFKNQTQEDNLHVLCIIPPFLNRVSLNACLQQKKRQELPPTPSPPYLTLLLHSLLPLSVKLSSSVPSAPKTQQSTHLPRMLQHPQHWRTRAALLWVCAAPILITFGEHTCENRCPLGLACCSSLGWRLHLRMSSRHSSPLYAQLSFSGPQQACLARKDTRRHQEGRGSSSPRYWSCSRVIMRTHGRTRIMK